MINLRKIVTKEIEVSANIVVPICKTYKITKEIEIDSQELKHEGVTEEDYIQDVFDNDFISEAEKKLQKDFEAGEFEDAAEYDQELENVEGEIL